MCKVTIMKVLAVAERTLYSRCRENLLVIRSFPSASAFTMWDKFGKVEGQLMLVAAPVPGPSAVDLLISFCSKAVHVSTFTSMPMHGDVGLSWWCTVH